MYPPEHFLGAFYGALGLQLAHWFFAFIALGKVLRGVRGDRQS